jgi:hypothetical protein
MIWVDIVLSTAILDLLTPKLAESVFEPTFLDKFKTRKNSDQDIVKLKLMNIKAVSEIELGMTLEVPLDYLDFSLPLKSSDVRTFKKSVLSVLENFIPTQKFMETNIKSSVGAQIDAEFIVNDSLKPLPISEYGTRSHDMRDVDLKPLPEGFRRVCLLSLGFKDCLLNDPELVGFNSLVMRLLKRKGFVVMIVSQNDFQPKMTAVNKVVLLQKMIKEVLHNSDL